MTPQPHNSSDAILVSRPSKGLWVVVLMLMLMALAFPLAERFDPGSRPIPTQADRWAELFMILMFGLPALALAWGLIRCRIVTHASGITLSGFFRSSYHEWREIEDYELRIPKSSRPTPTETPMGPAKTGVAIAYLKVAGQWRALPSLLKVYTHCNELLETIAREAKWSQSKEWQRNDLRQDGDWPKTFVYRKASGWTALGIYWSYTLLILAPHLFKMFSGGFASGMDNITLTWAGLAFWGRFAYLAFPLIVYGVVPLFYLAPYATIKSQRDYVGQKIVATLEGLIYQKDENEIFVPWDEIESYHLEVVPGHFQRLCVVQARGARVEFLTAIGKSGNLRSLIKLHATRATTKSWAYLHGADEDVLGGPASLWPSGKPGVGLKLHHHRTRVARAMLALGFFMAGVLTLPLFFNYLVSGFNTLSGSDLATNIWVVLLAGAVPGYGLLVYLRSTVQCDESGIRQQAAWGEKYLSWSEVEKVEENGAWLLVSAKKTKIRISLSIADVNGLKSEIKEWSGKECVHNGNAF